MKILEINKFYYLKRGAERHFLDLIELLESRGHEVAVFSMDHPKNRGGKWGKYFLSSVGYTDEFSYIEKIKGVFRMFYSLEAKRKINEILDDFKPDVVHIHNIYHQLSPAILFEIKKRKIPIVMTVHDFKIVSPNHGLYLNGKFYDRCKEGKFYQCLLDRCVKNSYAKSFLAMLEMYWHGWLGTYSKNIDLYIAPSHFVKEILVGRGVESEKIEVLAHFINDAPHPSIEKTSHEMQSSFALYAGAISRAKGVLELCSLFEKINQKKLLLAGNLEDISEKEFESFSNVEYVGFLGQSQLLDLMEKSECIVSGSRLPETFGLSALESISLGIPFFGFASGAYDEIIQNGKNGYLAGDEKELKDELEKLFKGITLYDSEQIKADSESRYEKNAYAERFEGLLKKKFDIDKKSVF